MKVGAVDPGGRSGLVEISFQFRGPAHDMVRMAGEQDRLVCRNVSGTEIVQSQELYRRLNGFDVVVIEDYIIRAPLTTTKREALSPVRIGFGLELLLTMSPKFSGRIVWQQSGQIGVITNDRLRAWGLWMPGKENKDIMSAMKHLIIFLRGNPGPRNRIG